MPRLPKTITIYVPEKVDTVTFFRSELERILRTAPRNDKKLIRQAIDLLVGFPGRREVGLAFKCFMETDRRDDMNEELWDALQEAFSDGVFYRFPE